MSRLQNIADFLNGRTIPSGKSEYHCLSATPECIVFGLSDKTRKVMIPTEVALEWIQAVESGVVDGDETAREMREKIAPRSSWAPFQHGFETHLKAITVSWVNSNSPNSQSE